MHHISQIIQTLSPEDKKIFITGLKLRNKRNDTKNIELFRLMDTQDITKNAELALYGKAFEALQSGKLLPENEEEVQFVAAMLTSDESHLYSVQLWKKYLAALEKSRVHHGFSMSNGKTRDASGNDLSFA